MTHQIETNDTPTACDTSGLQRGQDASNPSSDCGHPSEDVHPNFFKSNIPNTQSEVRARSWRDHLNKAFGFFILALIFLHICALTTAIGIYFWYDLKSDDVVLVSTAGHALRADQSVAMFASGMVETDKGYYCVETPMSVIKDEALTLELRGNGMRHLCDVQHHCTPLLHTFFGSWS